MNALRFFDPAEPGLRPNRSRASSSGDFQHNAVRPGNPVKNHPVPSRRRTAIMISLAANLPEFMLERGRTEEPPRGRLPSGTGGGGTFRVPCDIMAPGGLGYGYRRNRQSMKLRLLLFLLLSGPAKLYADVALLLEQPHSAFGFFNPTGHMAVYLSRICAESPTELRRCRAGEHGVVISRYSGIADLDWVAIPPIPYFYAVERRRRLAAATGRRSPGCGSSTGYATCGAGSRRSGAARP